MNNPDTKWFHYLTISFWAQIGLCALAAGIFLLQIMAYTLFDHYSSHATAEIHSHVCELTHAPTRRITSRKISHTTISCAGTDVELTSLNSEHLYLLLTSDLKPSIVCEQTITKFLNSSTWQCQVETAET